MSRLTVVVPVYNVEKYLDECLSSVAGQDFGDFEVVCVNDGSTDGSREILSAWERRDARVRVVDQRNGGLSSARNAGIRAARGDYVCFLDSDDRLAPGACGRIVEVLDRTGADAMVYGARCFPDEAACPAWMLESLSPRDVTYEGFSMDLLLRESARPFAWRIALRRDFLEARGVLFDEGVRFGEDQVFCFAVYPRSRRTALVSDRLYEYRVGREGSLMSALSADFGAKMLAHNRVLERILADWDGEGILGAHAPEMVGFCMGFSLYDALKLDDGAYLPVAEGLREILSRYWSRDEVAAMPLPRATRRMALFACYRTCRSRAARTAMAAAWRVQEKGAGSLVRRLAERAGGPRG